MLTISMGEVILVYECVCVSCVSEWERRTRIRVKTRKKERKGDEMENWLAF